MIKHQLKQLCHIKILITIILERFIEDQIHMYYLLFTVQFILFFIALTDYSKWKLISFFTITAVLILYSIYTHDTGQIIMCILDMVFIGFYWFYKKRH